ncbi:acyltransferase [Pseudodesulfovibrio methanolicus]|uniref:Acyltransferase n=1 Tax=Pseudodesulfovibrio methanolicus TaxID=3126690 RepID=A0ABZ2IYZ6_9BACT
MLRRTFPGVTFGALVQVLGLDGVSIGEGTLVGDGTWLNVCSRATGSAISVGRCVQLGRYGMFNSGGSISIGDYCLFGPHVVVSNADHVIDDVTRPYVDQGAHLGGRTVIGDNCWIAANVCILGSLEIGRGSVIGAGSVIARDVPPFAVVAGNPGRVAKLYNPLSERWERVASEVERAVIFEARERAPLPDAETYRRQLAERSATRTLPPEFAGNGVCY